TSDRHSSEYMFSPAKRLLPFYRQAGRNAEGRAVVLHFAQPLLAAPPEPGAAAANWARNLSELAGHLLQFGYPLDAVRLYSTILAEGDGLEGAADPRGQSLLQQAERNRNPALQAITAGPLSATTREVLKPADKPGPAGVLDLAVFVPGRDLQSAELMSLFTATLQAAADTPGMRAEIATRLAE